MFFRMMILTLFMASFAFSNMVLIPLPYDQSIMNFSTLPEERDVWNVLVAQELQKRSKHDVILKTPSVTATPMDTLVQMSLVSYRTTPSIYGQKIGTLTLKVTFTVNGQNIVAPYTLTQSGERHWGDNTPFENALLVCIKEVGKKFALEGAKS